MKKLTRLLSSASCRKYLLSHTMPCLHAFSFGVDAIKSLVLMSAVVERRLTVEEAVDLARLEVQVQVRGC